MERRTESIVLTKLRGIKLPVTLIWCFVFLVNVAVPAVVVGSQNIGPGKVLFCTSNGLEWIDLAQEQGDGETQNVQALHCVLCLNQDDELSDEVSTRASAAGWPLSDLAFQVVQHRIPFTQDFVLAIPRAPPFLL